MFQFSAPLQLGAVASYTQSLCVYHLPDTQYHDLYAAILCDQKIGDANLRADFARTALLHLIVASGTHLILIERFMNSVSVRYKAARLFLGPLLLAFALATGLSAPFVRILCAWGYASIQRKFRLGWSSLHILILAGFTTLLINFSLHRDGSGLLSLALSWIAGTAILCIRPQRQQGRRSDEAVNQFQLQITMYCFMIPALLPLAVPHPMSILWNLLLAPLLSALFFPLALLAAFSPHFIVSGIDFIFALMVKLLHLLAGVTPDGLQKYRMPILWPWIYLFSLSLAAVYLHRRERTRKLDLTDSIGTRD